MPRAEDILNLNQVDHGEMTVAEGSIEINVKTFIADLIIDAHTVVHGAMVSTIVGKA